MIMMLNGSTQETKEETSSICMKNSKARNNIRFININHVERISEVLLHKNQGIKQNEKQ